jgi:hypothetical protein
MWKHEKCTYEASVTVTSFEENSFLTSLEVKKIIKSSLETRHIAIDKMINLTVALIVLEKSAVMLNQSSRSDQSNRQLR